MTEGKDKSRAITPQGVDLHGLTSFFPVGEASWVSLFHHVQKKVQADEDFT